MFESDEVIAAQVDTNINGYRIYASDDYVNTLNMHYSYMPKEKGNRIEIYNGRNIFSVHGTLELQTGTFENGCKLI